MSETSDLLAQAVAQHTAGRLDVAEHLYRALLALDADHAEANHGFGALALELGQTALGLVHLQRALELAPETARYWLGLAEGMVIAQRPEDARLVMERGLALGLDGPAALDLVERIQALVGAGEDSGTEAKVGLEADLGTDAEVEATAATGERRPEPEMSDVFEISERAEQRAMPGSPSKKKVRPGPIKNRNAQGTKSPAVISDRELCLSHFEQGDHATALKIARKLTRGWPKDAFGWKMLGAALYKIGRLDESLRALEKSCRLDDRDAAAQNQLGLVLKSMGRMKDALDAWNKAVLLSPDFSEAHNNRGSALLALGRQEEAIASYRKALEVRPNYVDAWSNLAGIHGYNEQREEALSCYMKVLDLIKEQTDQKHLEMHVRLNVGNLLQDLGRPWDSVPHYLRLIDLDPNQINAYNNLGNALQSLHRSEEALELHEKAIAINPNCENAYNSLGTAYKSLGRLESALEAYRNSLAIAPDFAETHNNVGITLQDLGRFDEAAFHYQRALEIKPNFLKAIDNLLFALNYHPDKSAEEIFEVYREYDRRFGLPHRATWRPHTNDRDPNRRLRVGYVSPDFRQHSVAKFLEPILANHNRESFELFAYAELSKEDAMTARYRACVDHWIPTSGIGDAAMAERIRADGIDILVDVAGHTAGNRLAVFARKPAPISVSWLGYGYTTGLSAIDYYLTDAIMAPSGSESLFAETPWRLSGPFLTYRPADGMGEVGSLPAELNGFVTFGTLSRSVRINHRTIRVWAEILRRVPRSRLIVDSLNFGDPPACEKLAARFADHGIGRERLALGYHSPPWDLLRTIDIGLDCFPHNSGTTLLEHLYMGMPFVTLAERPSVGRIGASVLHYLGHSEWIAESEDTYVEIAVALARDSGLLTELRGRLRGEMQTSLLMDEPAFARRLEQDYREMWERWCEGG